MGTPKEVIRSWLYGGRKEGATHIVVVCDTFSYSDHPVYVKPGQDAQDVVDQNRGSMSKVMEVYDYSIDLEGQLEEHRAMHI